MLGLLQQCREGVSAEAALWRWGRTTDRQLIGPHTIGAQQQELASSLSSSRNVRCCSCSDPQPVYYSRKAVVPARRYIVSPTTQRFVRAHGAEETPPFKGASSIPRAKTVEWRWRHDNITIQPHFFGLMARWLASLPELSDRWLGKNGFCAWGLSVTLWSRPSWALHSPRSKAANEALGHSWCDTLRRVSARQLSGPLLLASRL
ncbi:hypothetical protein EDB92DRAFT_1316352 [Lactarius akahatsu]|uniref:Uncharacterized protein n=1 Tax=Lactarius akahatsu TaxID=416441 RepID=A0AAD4LPJ6_9AGAM|nr:hypothetical protein EDB92DRAFT_1316352 [Lactarius akahatsu]